METRQSMYAVTFIDSIGIGCMEKKGKEKSVGGRILDIYCSCRRVKSFSRVLGSLCYDAYLYQICLARQISEGHVTVRFFKVGSVKYFRVDRTLCLQIIALK